MIIFNTQGGLHIACDNTDAPAYSLTVGADKWRTILATDIPDAPQEHWVWTDEGPLGVMPPALTKEQQEAARQAAYQSEADPLFFKYQRGTSTEAEWLDMIAEIKLRYPYPTEE